MLRFFTEITIGMFLGFQAPRYAQRCREMCKEYLDHLHDEAHREENG